MWRIPSPLFSGAQGNFVETFTTDELIGDLFTYLGSPSGVATVNWTIDGADLGNIIISNSFAPGSTFTFTCISGGRILGLGGNGGRGGDDFGTTGEAGFPGSAGGPALSSNGFTVDVDIDDGFLLGGGGGGGGGSFDPGNDDSGGGGGGGQGWNGGTGGAAGASIGLAPSTAGQAGTRSAPGTGGLQGGLSNPNSGGNGGKFGSGGQTGITWDNVTPNGVGPYRGGIGGRAGHAFSPSGGAALNLTGMKSEATLRSEGRIKGMVTSIIPAYGPISNESANVSISGANNTGITMQTNGNLLRGNLSGTPTTLTTRWLTATSSAEAAKYEVRERNNLGSITAGEDVAGTTFALRVNATPGNWSALTSARSQAINSSSGIQTGGTLLEIRRNDVPGNPDDEIICQFFVTATDENNL